MVQRRYASTLEDMVAYEVSYVSEESAGDDVVVTTSARHRTERRREPITITYTLVRSGSSWRVCDLAPDGVSTAETQRRSFTRLMRSEGFAGVCARLLAAIARADAG